jgi:phosphate transport system protein
MHFPAMSTAPSNGSPLAYSHLVAETIRACYLAKEAASCAAEGIATGSTALLESVRRREAELDALDREIDDGVTLVITQVSDTQARELLACMKFMIGLERIGDLLLSFVNAAGASAARLDPQDTRDLTVMASLLEKMLSDVGEAFEKRDMGRAVTILRADAEMDRLRNLVFSRHVENPEGTERRETLQVLFMTQSLERAGDHAKNLAEEICHFVSGHTVRHVLQTYGKRFEQMLLEWLRERDEKKVGRG